MDGSLIVPLTINDQQVTMVLNTASATSMLWMSAVKRLGLTPQSYPGNRVYELSNNKRLKTNAYVTGHAVTLAGVPVIGVKFLAFPVGQLPVDGIVGLDALQGVDFELNFTDRKLTLYAPHRCATGPVYWSEQYVRVPMHRGSLGDAFFSIEVGGRKIATTVDTGGALSTLPSDATHRLWGFDEHSLGLETQTDAQGKTITRYRAMAMTSHGLKIMNAQVQLIEARPDCNLSTWGGFDGAAQYFDCGGIEAPLTLGTDVLKHMRLYFAMKEKALYFTTAADESAAATPPQP